MRRGRAPRRAGGREARQGTRSVARPGSRLSPHAVDVALTAVVLVATVTEALVADVVEGPRWASALICAVMSLLLLWRRDHPLAMTVLLFALAIPHAAFFAPASERVATFFPALVLAYGGGAYCGRRLARAVLAVSMAGIAGVAVASATGDAQNVLFPPAVALLCWVGGRIVRTRVRLAAELHEAAALAAEQREQEAQQAVADERRRIAREMHDVVAHSVSIMVVQAGGARRILATDAERAEQAAARIRRAGANALAEMNTLLGVLESGPDGARTPTLDGLPELVEQAEHAGLPVELTVSGERRPLPAGAEAAAYRVVQEALTNAIKHAGGATTAVELTWGEDELSLRIADRGDGGPTPQLQGAGHGLRGMGERVRPYGGDVSAGPLPGGGYEVHARIPLARREAPVALPCGC
jgi:signal transduction histidine kinase